MLINLLLIGLNHLRVNLSEQNRTKETENADDKPDFKKFLEVVIIIVDDRCDIVVDCSHHLDKEE